ncbi:hypothetical protein EYR38_010538 [Pleurotus pulmonarius]|nr:hypothetical protein EYR38_010538 [Pleurotus pulmonarius]
MPIQSTLAHALAEPDVGLLIMDLLSLRELRSYALTNKSAYVAVKTYFGRYFNIDRILRDFLPLKHLPLFRETQRRTGALIAGSAALQFFTRQKYVKSDLDLYVHEQFSEELLGVLVEMGCKIVPTRVHNTRSVTAARARAPAYGSQRGQVVVNLVSASRRKVQVIVTRRRPVESIMRYHSTTVMNFITGWYAYSLYGKETLEDGLALYTRPIDRRLRKAKRKYECRGWRTVQDGNAAAALHVFQGGSRTVGDDKTWIYRLDSASNHSFTDPFVRDMGWQLRFTPSGTRKEDWASQEQFDFLEGFIEAYSLTEPNTFDRHTWREGLHEEWTARYGKLKGNEKNLINTYFKNQTRPGGKWEKMRAQQGSSKELHDQRSQLQPKPIVDNLSVGTSNAESGAQGEQEESGSTVLIAPEQLPPPIIGKERAQSERPATYGLKTKDLRAKYPVSSTNERGRRVQRPERPIVRRHEGVNNLVVDIELPGFSLHEVSIFYQDAGLHLFAEKTDDPKWPTNLRRLYEGSLHVGKQKADHITCGMKEGLLRIVLEREEAEEGVDSPQDENLQILDYIPWDFN